jgi:hypothetical protein
LILAWNVLLVTGGTIEPGRMWRGRIYQRGTFVQYELCDRFTELRCAIERPRNTVHPGWMGEDRHLQVVAEMKKPRSRDLSRSMLPWAVGVRDREERGISRTTVYGHLREIVISGDLRGEPGHLPRSPTGTQVMVGHTSCTRGLSNS